MTSNGIITTVPRSGILVLDGYGLKVSVERGHLCLEGGIGPDRINYRLSRICKLKRLVILGHTGYLTFDAIRFIRDLGASLVVIDSDGELLLCEAATVVNYTDLRRTQALTIGTPKGFELARGLLRQKIVAQGQDTGELEAAGTEAQLRTAEAHAAAFYFGSWSFDVPWDKPVPEHWTHWTTRKSAIGNHAHNKRATDPVNACLNYCLAILESEVKIACLQMGLELGFSLIHYDAKAKGQHSVLYDLMEPLRVPVCEFVKQLAENGFKREMFHEGRDGCVRVLAPLTHILAQQSAEWRLQAATVVEDFCAALMESESVPTPLTSRRARAGIAAGKKRRAA